MGQNISQMMKTPKMKACDLSNHCILTKLFPLAEMSVFNKNEPVPPRAIIQSGGSKLSSYQFSLFLETFKAK